MSGVFVLQAVFLATLVLVMLALTFFIVIVGFGVACYLGVEPWCGIGPR